MKPLHAWDVDIQAAIQIQEMLRTRVIRKNGISKVRTVGGADVAYSGEDTLLAAVLVFSYPDLELLEIRYAAGKVTFPYIPGLLAFREGPILIEAFENLEARPDVMFFESQGIAHPRGFGMASHLGLWLDLPSIGCAKTPLLKTDVILGRSKGSHQPVLREGLEVGSVVRTRTNVKPVFVSPGHRIDLPTSIQWVLATCRGYRMPEPLRQADQIGRSRIRQMGFHH